jgi:pimeloyl-ACP methyl ester carboxylesterase
VLESALDDLGVGEVDVLGSKTGSVIGIELAARLPERVANLILDGVPLFDAALAAQLVQRYGTDITPRHGGGHLLAAWDAMRASTMWFPWYQRERANRLDFAIATAPQIDRFAIDLLKAGRGYDAIFKAVFGNDTAARLPAVTARTLVATAPEDLCLDFTRRAVSLLPHGSAAGVAPNPREHGEYYAAFSLGREAAAVYIEFLDGR